MMRALVIHPGALGDVLQAVPSLRALGADTRAAFCGQPRLAALLAGTGVVGTALSFDAFGLEALFTDEPAPPALAERIGAFDRVVSWFGSRDPRYPARLASLVSGPRAGARSCIVAPPVPLAARPVWRHLLDTLSSPGEPAPPRAWPDDPALRQPLAVPAEWRREARVALDRLGISRGPALVVHPGAGGHAKLVDPALLATAVERLVRARGTAAPGAGPLEVVIHQGPADREPVERLAALLRWPAAVLREPALPLLAAVLAQAGGYLAGDSGVSHLAAAVGAPSAILMSRDTRARWTPWSATARVVAVDGGDPAAGEVAAAALLPRLAGRPRAAAP
jgi:ADP-heptose:LPS heptosyltransferase